MDRVSQRIRTKVSKVKGFFQEGYSPFIRKHLELVIVVILSSIILIDLSGLDANIYKIACSPFERVTNKVACPDFYDIPFWNFLGGLGSLLAVAVAVWAGLQAIQQANEQEKNAQELQMDQDIPIVYLNPGPKLHRDGGVRIELFNVGKGIAKDVYVFLEGTLVDGNFSMHTLSPTNSSKLEIKSIDTGGVPSTKAELAQKIQQLSAQSELEMKISYFDIHGRKFITDQIIFEKDQAGDYMHNRGKWSFRKVYKEKLD